MLAELMQFLTEEEQRIAEQQTVRRSLALAQRRGLGPFKRVASAPSFIPAYVPQKPVPLLACDMSEPTLTIDSVVYGLKRSHDIMHFTMAIGGLKMHMSMHKDGDHQALCSYTIVNQPDQYWAQSYTPMNNYMARHMVQKLRDAIIDAPFLQSMIDAEAAEKKIKDPIDVDTLRHYAEKALDHLAFNAPWRRIAVTGQRPGYEYPSEKRDGLFGVRLKDSFNNPSRGVRWGQIENGDMTFIDDSPSNLNGNPPPLQSIYTLDLETIPHLKENQLDSAFSRILGNFWEAIKTAPQDKGELAFEDAKTSVHAVPVFNNNPESQITGKYGAFSFQEDGQRYWIQFTDLNGNDTAEFLTIRPRQPSHTDREMRTLYKEEALEAISKIRQDLDATEYPWVNDVLERLKTAAQELKSDMFYFKRKGIQTYLKHFGIEDPFKAAQRQGISELEEYHHPKFFK